MSWPNRLSPKGPPTIPNSGLWILSASWVSLNALLEPCLTLPAGLLAAVLV